MLLSEAVSSDRSENLNAILLATSRVLQSSIAVPVCISLSTLCAYHILLGLPLFHALYELDAFLYTVLD